METTVKTFEQNLEALNTTLEMGLITQEQHDEKVATLKAEKKKADRAAKAKATRAAKAKAKEAELVKEDSAEYVAKNLDEKEIKERIGNALDIYVSKDVADEEAFTTLNQTVASLFNVEPVIAVTRLLEDGTKGKTVSTKSIALVAWTDKRKTGTYDKNGLVDGMHAVYIGIVDGKLVEVKEEEKEMVKEEMETKFDADIFDRYANIDQSKFSGKVVAIVDPVVDKTHANIAVGIDKATDFSKTVNDKGAECLVKGIDIAADVLKKAVSISHGCVDKGLDLGNTGAHVVNDTGYKAVKKVIGRPATNLSNLTESKEDQAASRKAMLEQLRKK